MNYFEIEPEKNAFKIIYVDASHRCNMACFNCFIPNREKPDLDFPKFQSFLNRLNGRTEIRLFGGEPTLNPRIFDIIREARSRGHSVTLVTNGLKLADNNFTKSLHEAGLREVNVSMNGGTDRQLYRDIDNMDCLDRKLKAVENVVANRMRLRLGAILVRGQNDQVPGQLFQLALKYDITTTLNFRNVAQMGRYMKEKNENHSFADMVALICEQVNFDVEEAFKHNSINSLEQERIVFFPVQSEGLDRKRRHRIWIKITDWSPPGYDFPDPGSARRGRLTEDFKLAPAFEHIKLNENGY